MSLQARLFKTFILTCCLVALPATAQPDFTGIWSGSFMTQDDPYWQLEDFPCFPGCPLILHQQLKSLLEDPANASFPTEELNGRAFTAMINDRMARATPEGITRIEASVDPAQYDPASACDAYGFMREIMAALPMRITEVEGGLRFDYEEFSQTRVIHLDGRALPVDPEPAQLGYSVGHVEGNTLVVETNGIRGDYLIGLQSPTTRWGSFADGATAVEHYALLDNPRRLVLEVALSDPVTLKEPYVWTKTWLHTPDMELLEDSCEDVPAQP